MLLSVVLSACASTPARHDSPAVTLSLDQAWQGLVDRTESLRGLRGLAMMSRSLGGKGRLVLLARRPGEIRGELLTDMGASQLQFLCHAGELTVYWPMENRYQITEATPAQMKAQLALPLRPEEVVALLLAAPPLGPKEGYGVGRKKQRTFLQGEQQKIWLLPQGGGVVPERIENPDFAVNYSDYVTVQGILFPRAVEVVMHHGGTFRLSFDQIDLNPILPNPTFNISIPKNAEAIH